VQFGRFSHRCLETRDRRTGTSLSTWYSSARHLHAKATATNGYAREIVEVAELTGQELRVLPEDINKLMASADGLGTARYERDMERAEKRKVKHDAKVQHEADLAKVKADPEAYAAFRDVTRRVKRGPGGAPIPDEDYPPAPTEHSELNGPYLIAARDKAHKEMLARREAEQYPGRPPKGKKMNQWTPENWLPRKRTSSGITRPSVTPGFDSDYQPGDVGWFIRACP